MPTQTSTATRKTKAEAFVLAHPLDEFYAQMGQPLPPLHQVDGEAVPQPYKQLLVHHDDMTPTLEKFYRQDIHLRVLGRRRRDEEYFREVVLLLDGNDQPVEFGAIKINFHLFPPEARKQILEERRPLGHILHEQGIKHSSRPKAYLRLASDKVINEALGLTGAHVLYGRRNTLFDPEDRPLAEIVEILPPASKRGEERE
jgi:chorismate-pyruvate lyase